MKKWGTIGVQYEGPERRCGGQRRRPMVDPKAEEVMHGKGMMELTNIIADREIKQQHGYDAAVLYWHVTMRHKFRSVKYFFPQAPYHQMLGMSEAELEEACRILEKASLLKRTEYEGKTGYKILSKEKNEF